MKGHKIHLDRERSGCLDNLPEGTPSPMSQISSIEEALRSLERNEKIARVFSDLLLMDSLPDSLRSEITSIIAELGETKK